MPPARSQTWIYRSAIAFANAAGWSRSTFGRVVMGARTIRTPSGQEWQVGRSWIGRRMPRWRQVRMGKFRNGKVGAADAAEAVFSIPDFGGIDDLGAAILVLAAVVVVA